MKFIRETQNGIVQVGNVYIDYLNKIVIAKRKSEVTSLNKIDLIYEFKIENDRLLSRPIFKYGICIKSSPWKPMAKKLAETVLCCDENMDFRTKCKILNYTTSELYSKSYALREQ